MSRLPSGPGSSSGSEQPTSTSAPATARAVSVGMVRGVLMPFGRGLATSGSDLGDPGTHAVLVVTMEGRERNGATR